MADSGSSTNLASPLRAENGATGAAAEEKETRRQFNYPLVKVLHLM
jgi:hypothetical protein